jgi:hypothetical protein
MKYSKKWVLNTQPVLVAIEMWTFPIHFSTNVLLEVRDTINCHDRVFAAVKISLTNQFGNLKCCNCNLMGTDPLSG